jgi:ribbon-helix-helix CopG family protein
MVRTQIQLTESQAAALKKMAALRQTSMADVIRQAIDYFAKTGEMTTSDEYRRRAMAAAGKLHSGLGHLAEKHDDYLAEAFDK